MKKLIVNADDYGHTSGVSEGIRQAHLHGIVTSTSVMMNRPSAPMELKKAAGFCPNLGIGIHLVLTTGSPLLPPDKVATLICKDGSFYKQNDFIGNITQIDIDQVSAEWYAQVEKFYKVNGHAPDHLDSHHHSSYFTPILFERMLRLAEEVNCPIRKPFGDDSADPSDYLPDELAKKSIAEFKSLPRYSHLRTTDKFIGDFYDDGATVEHLINIFEKISADPDNQSYELMCHPAVVDEELKLVSSYNIRRSTELNILMNDQIRRMLPEQGIILINYSQM